MPVIYCNINMFEYDQTVYKMNEDGTHSIIAKVPLNELEKFVVKYCNTENIDEVHIVGSHLYTEKIKNKIVSTNKTKYANNIDIKVVLEEK